MVKKMSLAALVVMVCVTSAYGDIPSYNFPDKTKGYIRGHFRSDPDSIIEGINDGYFSLAGESFWSLWNRGSEPYAEQTVLYTLAREGFAKDISRLMLNLKNSIEEGARNEEALKRGRRAETRGGIPLPSRLDDERFSDFETLRDYATAVMPSNGNNALHIAALMSKNDETLKALLDPKFALFTAEDVTKENNAGDTPISLAAGNDKLSEAIQMRLVELSTQMGAPWETGMW